MPSTRVLVVDDNRINREVLGAILATQDLMVDFAVDGQEAVALATAVPYDLILMDYQMPLMDGLTATALIRREEQRSAARSRAQLYIVSACDEAEVGRRAQVAGADGFIGKPIVFSHILALAQTAASRGVARRGGPTGLGSWDANRACAS